MRIPKIVCIYLSDHRRGTYLYMCIGIRRNCSHVKVENLAITNLRKKLMDLLYFLSFYFFSAQIIENSVTEATAVAFDRFSRGLQE